MIRVIDLAGQIYDDGEKHFAFYDTVVDGFVGWPNEYEWSTWRDFVKSYKLNGGWRGMPLERFEFPSVKGEAVEELTEREFDEFLEMAFQRTKGVKHICFLTDTELADGSIRKAGWYRGYDDTKNPIKWERYEPEEAP